MRNLKKVLALVVAVAMIASMGLVASAASYSDVAANAKYADAVNLLSNLGVINGYEDGTFRPDNTVTRAEAAAMLVRVLGLAEDVEMGETNFTDVAADNWASGYVNVAEANGIVNGMGDGTFNPNGEVTYGQIVKMIVCALGYEPMAEAKGGYLGGGYIYAGSKTGFTKGVAGTANAAASRATVAQLIYNALEVELMEQDSFSTGIYGDTFKVQEGKTILSEYLELEKVDGVVVETYLSTSQYDADADKTVSIVVTKNYAEDEIAYEAGDVVPFIAEGTDAATFLGYTVTAFVGENEDGEDAIFSIAPKAKKNSALVLDTDLIESFDGSELVYYKSESAKSTTEAEVKNVVEFKDADLNYETANVVVNGFNVEYELIAGFDYELLEEVTFLDNNGDGDFDFIFATMPAIATGNAVEFVVATAEEDDAVWTWADEEETTEFEIDEEDETVLYTIVKDGKIADASAIVEGDVITVLDNSVNVVTVYVSSVVVEGTVDEVDDDAYTINGKEYTLSPIAMAEEELEAGDEGKFYVNASGKIAAVDTVNSIATADYVYVIDADVSEGDFDADEYIVKVVTAKGEIEVLTIKSKKVSINGESKDEEGNSFEDADLYATVEEYVGIARIDVTAAGELSGIYFPESDDEFMVEDTYAEENEKEYNEARGTYGIVDLAADVLVFHVDTTEEDLEDAITVTTVGDLFVDESSYQFVAYGEEEEVPSVLVAFDAKTGLDSEEPVMVVTKVSKVVADDENSWKITGVVAGETVTVVVDPEEATAVAPVAKGNVILYATTAGYATDVQVLFASDDEAPAADVTVGGDIVGEPSEEAVSVHYGEIEEKTTKTVTIEGAKYYYADEVNVTVVDYTGANVSIAKGSLSSVKASNDKYTRTAFVKTVAEVEDEISDIVIFVERVAE